MDGMRNYNLRENIDGNQRALSDFEGYSGASDGRITVTAYDVPDPGVDVSISRLCPKSGATVRSMTMRLDAQQSDYLIRILKAASAAVFPKPVKRKPRRRRATMRRRA